MSSGVGAASEAPLPPGDGALHRIKGLARSSTFVIWFGTGLASAIWLLVVAWSANASYARAIEAARASVEGTALVLEEHANRTLSAVDMLLQVVLHEKQDISPVWTDREAEILGKLSWQVPQVKRLSILAVGTGSVVAKFNGSRDIVDEAEIDALQAHTLDYGLSLHIGPPRRDPTDGTWVVGVSRRKAIAHGESIVAVAQMHLGDFQHFFQPIDIGPHGSVTLFRKDGTLLARKPYAAADVGRNVSGGPLFGTFLPEGRNGTRETLSSVDGVRRILSYRTLKDAPLVIVNSRAKEDVLAPWREDALKNLVGACLGIAAMAGFSLRLSREARRRDKAEAQAREKSAMLEAALENMDQGIIMCDADATVQVFNRRFTELLEVPADLMASKPPLATVLNYQFSRAEFSRTDERFRDWVRTSPIERTPQTYERERPNGTVLEIRTVPLSDGGAVRTYADVTAQRAAHRQIAHMAKHDVLTGLPNRLFFRERMEEALADLQGSERKLALLCIDLDLFKTVNDTLGHPAGDEVLVAVSRRIRDVLGEGDTVVRLGGDEFAIVQIDADQPGGAEALAKRLCEVIGEPCSVQGHEVHVGASIGIALAPDHGQDPDHVLKSADLALYRSKADGRGTYRFFETEMDTQVQERRSLEVDLREALATDALELHYQPFVDGSSGAIVGFEALLRWRHPKRGLVSPADFVPLAEETGLIVPIGEWVLRRACADAATWPGGLRVAVNVSAAQFRSPNLVQAAMWALGSAGLAPQRLEIEITETVLMRNTDGSLKALHQLRALGVSIAMDDFGTGYSSLSYLRSFPFDRIKIDRTFVKELGQNPDCLAIVRAILGLGARLGIAVTAEGVELEDQMALLKEEGCAEMQGYLFSRPVPAADALRLLPRAAAVAVA